MGRGKHSYFSKEEAYLIEVMADNMTSDILDRVMRLQSYKYPKECGFIREEYFRTYRILASIRAKLERTRMGT